MVAVLTAPEAFAQSSPKFRYMAQLASKQLDFEGVPVAHRMIDVVVNDPTPFAISKAIADAHWLKDYSLVSYWLPEDGCPEF